MPPTVPQTRSGVQRHRLSGQSTGTGSPNIYLATRWLGWLGFPAAPAEECTRAVRTAAQVGGGPTGLGLPLAEFHRAHCPGARV